jgi:uncharacterized membrane-anchored protein YitT (DUF2179 family)
MLYTVAISIINAGIHGIYYPVSQDYPLRGIHTMLRKKLASREVLQFKRSDIWRIILCICAGILMSVNLRTFVYTGNLLPGGFAGLTLLLQAIFHKFLGITVPYGVIYFLMNSVPIVIAFKFIGKKFTLYSCITILLVTFLTDIIPVYAITYDVLLISIFGGLINGFAITLCLKADATTGGTDFIAIAISERFGIDSFNYILFFNAIILTIDGYIFGWDKALYSIIFQFSSTQVIHILYKRYKKNTLLIVTQKPKEIADMIYELTGHGATDIEAYGSYQNADRTIVYSVVSSDELRTVVSEILDIDPDAFLNVIKTEQLSGKFHLHPND